MSTTVSGSVRDFLGNKGRAPRKGSKVVVLKEKLPQGISHLWKYAPRGQLHIHC